MPGFVWEPYALPAWILAISGILALSYRSVKWFIHYVVQPKVDEANDELRKSVCEDQGSQFDALNLRLTTIEGEMVRIRQIEQVINNGLSERQGRIEEKLDSVIEHLMWDGRERRGE